MESSVTGETAIWSEMPSDVSWMKANVEAMANGVGGSWPGSGNGTRCNQVAKCASFQLESGRDDAVGFYYALNAAWEVILSTIRKGFCES